MSARLSLRSWPVSVALLVGIACNASSEPTSTFEPNAGGAPSAGDAGSSTGTPTDPFPDGGTSNAGDAGGSIGTLEAIVRDFKKYNAADPKTNPDFENVPPPTDVPPGKTAPYPGPWSEATPKYFPGADFPIDIVDATLGADGVPQYNPTASFNGTAGRTATTHGKSFFDQWYHDVPGVNDVRRVPITLTKNAQGVYSYDSAVSGVPLSPADPSKGFFPIDDGTAYATTTDGFGNQGNPHNYHFTVELHTKFKYRGNETFKFSGDDDVFVFINKKLVINIGGIHVALAKEVKLPDVAAEIGLVVGREYPLDFFQAERHVVQSNLRIDTTLELEAAPVH